MIADAPSQNLAELSERLGHLTSRRAQLQVRVSQLDTTIAEVQELAGEVETRLRNQESEVARLMTAAGTTISFGANHTQQTVTWTDGRGTQQLSGPRPMDTAQGKADHARRVYDALEAEAAPVRGALSSLERERSEVERAAGLLGAEINGVEGQIARMRGAEAERRELIGATSWRDRLSVILRRMGRVGQPAAPATARTVQELRAEGKSVREIAEATGISKSQVHRELTAAGVPVGTGELAEGA